ncbi:hypothetical protein EHS25_006674 [Saitozyma podzolica]|uniref:DUF7082 domain-containing protein n=1 Tax=Saitozyma podzolica TaxID=1890683 RepID=A0A427YSD9_9TREE|nr:hypothetical protein EHS25_006674 [Saitozyma podzolica]
MDTSYGPSTPITPDVSSFPPSASTMPRAYVSPHLAAPFEHLALAGTPASTSSEYRVHPYEYSPLEGGQGSVLSVKCEVNFPPSPPTSTFDGSASGQVPGMPPGRALRLVMGSYPVPTAVQVVPEQRAHSTGSQFCQLSATAPSWGAPGVAQMARGNRVPMYIQVLSEANIVLNSVLVGDFTYGNSASGSRPGMGYSAYSSPTTPIKREMDQMGGRSAPDQAAHRRGVSGGYKYESQDGSLVGQYHTPVMQSDTYASYPNPYGPPALNQGMPPAQASYPGSQPNLQRATQISQPMPTASSYPVSSSSKALLELHGDLNNMAKGWSTEEWSARRRLVQFWRKQEGTKITAAFGPIPQSEYSSHQNSIIISCIFREDNNCCYVTSVDAIYLLEALVGNRFTVEEKNRIRRNLEGFRPITVSKTKQGSEEFFKLIMGFPNPKPRNIEKDVKVFPWDILGQALRKIIGKYSATYAGLSTTPTPPQQGFAPLPVPAYPTMADTTPAPLQPLLDPFELPDTTPNLTHHSSSDSSTYSASSTIYPSTQPTSHQPDTPHLPTSSSGSHSHSHSASPTSATFRPTSQSDKLASEYLVLVRPGTFWATSTGVDQTLASPPTSGGFAPIGGPLNYTDQAHQLPHVHQTISREPSSNDLRVLYPGLAQ